MQPLVDIKVLYVFFSMAVGGGQRRGEEPIEASLTFESWVKKINVPSLLIISTFKPRCAPPRVWAFIEQLLM